MNKLQMETIVGDALRRAYSLGQTYWQQADSDYVSQNKKADATASKFAKLVDEIVEQVAARRAVPAQASAPAADAYRDCCDTPSLCSSVRRCTAKDAAQVPAQGEMDAKQDDKLALTELLEQVLALQPLANDGITGIDQPVTQADVEVCRKVRAIIATLKGKQ